jgi:hypothetical protein
MDYQKHLATVLEVVVFLFAAFSGFLQKIAPPIQPDASYAVGVTSFFVLLVLLVISALARKKGKGRARKAWIRAGIIALVVAFPLGLAYPWLLSRLTYTYPPPPETAVSRRVNGWELTETAKAFINENPGNYSPGQLELNLDYDDIWTPSSVSKARTILLVSYTMLVLSLATAVFCLLEANADRPQPAAPRKRKPPQAAE